VSDLFEVAAAPAGPASRDGRLARGERTRQMLAEALLELVAEGDLQPSARRLAERAGVSPRLVFHHFDDMESVLRTAATVHVQRHWTRLRRVPSSLPRAERIATVVGQRAEVYEAIAPVRRATRLVEHGSPEIAAQLQRARALLRIALEETFAPELEDLDPVRRQEVSDALEAAGAFETWERIYLTSDGSSRRAARTMELLMTAVCDGIETDGARQGGGGNSKQTGNRA
jgi:TetR/AcrR family transcriptional regulator, regulator of autoinduction and epiphytic fitness